MRFEQAPVTFGRDPGCGVVLAEPFVSREHGALLVEDERWVLVNRSPNGTLVNNKLYKAVNKRPRRLRDGDVVGVGNQPLFSVALEGVVATPADDGPDEDDDPRPKLGGKAKVWIGIGVYMVLMLGLVLFFTTLNRGNAGRPMGAAPRGMAPADIAAALREPLPPLRPADPARAEQYLQEAGRWYNRLDTEPDAAFLAHQAYQQALSAANTKVFDRGQDQQQFLDVQQRLTEVVTRYYDQGRNHLDAGGYQSAVQAFDELFRVYPAVATDPIYRSALELRNYAMAASKRR